MNRRLPPVALATVVCACSLVALGYLAYDPPSGDDELWYASHLVSLVPLGLGWLVAIRALATGGVMATALAWLAAFMLATPAVEGWGETNATDEPWWGSGFMAVVGAGVWPWQVVGFMFLLLVFPDGLLPGRRWRIVAGLVPVSAVAMNVAFVLTMNYGDSSSTATSPISVPEAIWEPVMWSALGALLGVVVACGASVAVRYRRGSDHVREQLRWLLLAAGGVVAMMVASWIAVGAGLIGEAAYGAFLLGIVVLVPAAVAIAVLRHDLFEIDRLLSDSMAWLLTTATAAGLLALAAVGFGHLVGPDSRLGLSGAVFVVALAFLPLHRRLHDAVGRILDRDRVVLLGRVGRFVDHVREGSAEPESVEDVLRSAVGDADLRLLLAAVEGDGYVDLAGRPADLPIDGMTVTLRTADAEIGVVTVSGGSTRQLRRVKLATTAARLPIEVSRLRLGLRRALSEVDRSRRRLVSATIEERKRLERDLHDGAQQQLVSVGMQLRAIQRQLPPDHPTMGELDQSVESLENTVGELRRLAHGVRPTSLDDGLAAALSRLGSDCPLPVDFAVSDAPVSEVVATTAYFVVAEAVANVLKHARATRISVSVYLLDGDLRVTVGDDGIGGTHGEFQLTALRDRVTSIGGRLSVTTAPHAGTTIEAVLPCVS